MKSFGINAANWYKSTVPIHFKKCHDLVFRTVYLIIGTSADLKSGSLIRLSFSKPTDLSDTLDEAGESQTPVEINQESPLASKQLIKPPANYILEKLAGKDCI